MKLYELSNNYNNIYDLVGDEEVDIDILENALTPIEDAIEAKFENISKIIKNIEGSISTFSNEEKRIKNRRITMENKIKWLKGYMLENLNVMERSSVESGTFKIRKQKNPPSVTITNQSKLDKKYLIEQEDKVDSKAIAVDLKAGVKVEGASYSLESYHIRIQ